MFAPCSKTTASFSGLVPRIRRKVSDRWLLLVLLVAVVSNTARAWEPWRFIAACDSRGRDDGIQKTILSELVGEIIGNEADFILFPGDLVSGHSAAGPAAFEDQLRVWVEIMQPVYDAGIAVYVGRGNHEIADSWGYANSNVDPNDNFTTRWLEVFGNGLYPQQKLADNGPEGEEYMTYSVKHKNALIVMLDQYAGLEHQSVHKVNQQWLDSQLSANMQPHVFVAGHEPAFRALHSDCLDNYPAERDALWTAIKQAGGRTYFCGHDHFYDHARIDDGDDSPNNDVHQYITGAAGAPLYSWSPPYSGDNDGYTVEQLYHAEGYGYTVVDVEGPRVTLTWMERQTRDLEVPGVYEPREMWSYTLKPELIVLEPNGKERVVGAKPYTIRWKTRGAEVESVTIDYSSDSGQNWRQLTQQPNTGRYEWDPVPTVDSTRCLVRVADAQNGDLNDISDELFSIFECRKQLPADLNGDCYVDFLDFAILVGNWLNCGNPLDASCD